jgi:hypothetical protein
MADVERITPPVPTLPPPVGRSVGAGGRRQRPPREPPRRPEPAADKTEPDHPPEHIDEYV